MESFILNGTHGYELDSIYKRIFNSVSIDDYENLNVVSFNYDRSFEFYFLNSLMSLHNIDIRIAHKILSKISIVHIYGRLPSLDMEIEEEYALPQIESQPKACIKYGTLGNGQDTITSVKLAEYAIKNLYTVYEDQTNQEDAFTKKISKVRNWISGSERVFFLGFGYHDLNMKVLGFHQTEAIGTFSNYQKNLKYLENLDKKFIIGTGYNLGGVERNRILRSYSSIKHLISCTNLQLFEDHVSLTNHEWDVIGT